MVKHYNFVQVLKTFNPRRHAHLRHFSPSYAAAFAATPLEPVFLEAVTQQSSEGEAVGLLGPAVPWGLLYKYGGLAMTFDVLLAVDTLDSYTNFVWFDPAAGHATLSIFRLQALSPNCTYSRASIIA